MSDFSLNVEKFGLQGVSEIKYQASTRQLSVSPNGFILPVSSPSFKISSGAAKSNRTSYLGTPIVSDLVLEHYVTPYTEPKNRIRFDTVLCEVSQTKNIVTTAVVGRAGTIKEYISDGDFSIKIRGHIVEQSHNYPEQKVRETILLLFIKEHIEVISDYLRMFDISQIVITDYSFSQKEGTENVQFFEISALSDTPENLIIDA